MIIKIKNSELNSLSLFLNMISVKGKEARAISKFKKILVLKALEYSEDERTVFKEYCVLDENGDLVIEDGKVTFLANKVQDGKKAYEELLQEECIINLTEFSLLDTLIQALENTELEMSGEDADMYDLLLTKLENIEQEKEK